MPHKGSVSTVKITGTPTAMVDEPTTELVADTVFQITNAAKRILDPDAAIVVEVNGAPVASNFVIDKLFGKVTFSPALAGGDTVAITGNYLPTLDVLECREFTVTNTRDLADSTVFKPAPAFNRTKFALLKHASGSISSLRALLDDLDAGGGTVKLQELLASGTRKVLELALGDSGYVWRGWVLFPSQEVRAAFDDLVQATVPFETTLDDSAGGVLGNSLFGVGLL